MTPARRELLTSIALCLVGSGLVLLAVRQPWATYATDRLTIKQVRHPVDGTAVAGASQALALVGLAGVVAIAATRRTGRVVVGVILALAGVLVVVDVAHLLGDLQGRLGRASGLKGLRIVSTEEYDSEGPHWAWPALTMVGGLVLACGGLVVATRGRRWAALGSSYQVPAARAAATQATDKSVWDALDSGEDPTA